MFRTFIFVLLCLGSSSLLASQDLALFLHLRNGSSIVAQTSQPDFAWIEYNENENQPVERIAWQDIQELTLTESQVEEEIRFIENLLRQLNDPDYTKREKAEFELSNPELTASHQSLLRRFANTNIGSEAKYRMTRIMTEIEGAPSEPGQRFDELIMKDGKRKTGNAVDFSINGTAFDQPFNIERDNTQTISLKQQKVASGNAEPIQIKTYNVLNQRFYDPNNSTIASFETDHNGSPTVIGQDVNNAFLHQGLLLSTEMPGYMKLIKYQFKYCPIETGKRCVCPFDEQTGKRLHGNTLLSFCPPDQPNIVAGVHRVGLFLEQVEHSRDIVVEAYNIHGQMIGMVEATDQICVFAGFESNELITRIRISSNEDLPELERNIDRSYAIDCVTFDKPIAINQASLISNDHPPHKAKVNLLDGQSQLVNDIETNVGEIQFANAITQRTENRTWDQVHSIAFPDLLADRISTNRFGNSNDTLMIQLNDGSIVRTEKSDLLSAFDFIGHSFDRQDVVGFWHKKARLPLSADFKAGQPVLVYPSCRIITTDFSFRDNKISWDKSKSVKQIQDVILFDENEDVFSVEQDEDPDLTPQVDRVNVTKSGDVPSVWFKRPMTAQYDKPHVRLFDGQYFVLGEGSFSVSEINNQQNSISIAIGGKAKTYPMSRIASISLPKSVKQ